MGRYTVITCDVCGEDIYGQEYFTASLRKIRNGVQVKVPTMWLCRDCMLKTQLLMFAPTNAETEDK